MNLCRTDELRSLVERPERVTWWGQRFVVTPRLIEHTVGDGGRLLCLQPLTTRPNYFLLRVDSADDFDIRDHLDDVIDAAEDQFGRYRDPDDRLEDESDDEYEFPVADWDYGCCWGEPFSAHEWLTEARFDAWMDRLERLVRKRRELRRRIYSLAESERLELWAQARRLLSEVDDD